MIISLIVAADENNAIGNQNQLLCHLPADLKYFRQTTTGHHIVMGRKTFESVGRPLPNRVNIVISHTQGLAIEGCVVLNSLEAAIAYAKDAGESELFITGGGNIFNQSMAIANRIYLTRIYNSFTADTFFPDFGEEWNLIQDEVHEADEKNPFNYSFQVYEK